MAAQERQRPPNQIISASKVEKTHHNPSPFVYWVIQQRREALFLSSWGKGGSSAKKELRPKAPPEGGGQTMKIVVVRSPKALRGILKSIFKVK